MTALFSAKGDKDLHDEVERLTEENTRLHRSVEELSILNEIAMAVNSTMTVEEINRLIVEKCVRRLDVEQGVIHLLDEEKTDVMKTLVRVRTDDLSGLPFRFTTQLKGWMAKNQTTLVSNDLGSDERFIGTQNMELPFRSLLSAPLKYKGRMVGLITVFNMKSAEGFTADSERLLTIIAAQCAQVIENARLYQQEQKLKAHEHELDEARRIQEQLLPQRGPDLDGIDIAGTSQAATQVGGDFFDYVDLGGGRWGICVADITGHGLAAALMMSNLQATLRASAKLTGEPHACVAAVNRLLSEAATGDAQKYATLFYGVLEITTRTLAYTNAGHNPPLLLRGDGVLERLETGGLMLGVMKDAPYDQADVALGAGDCLVVFTDGITEAEDREEVQYDDARLIACVNRLRGEPMTKLVSGVINDVELHRRGAPVDDDATLVAIKMN